MAEENFITLVVIFMKENLLMIWPKVSVSINMQMDQNMLATGIKINNMVLVRKSGMMEVNIKDSTKMHQKKVKENIAGQMVTGMWENGKIIC